MKITGVAILIGKTVWALPAPKRHHDVIRMVAADLKLMKPVKGIQGFVSDSGEFLDRVQARALVVSNGQCAEPENSRELFSEDLW